MKTKQEIEKMKDINDATHVIFNGDTCCYVKRSNKDWFIDLGDGWQNIKEWRLISVYWLFGWKINIYGMTHKLIEVNK